MRIVILAGSSGSRLFPITLGKPKALLPIVNKPALLHMLCSLERSGFSEAIIATTEEFSGQLGSFLMEFHGTAQSTTGMKTRLEVFENSLGTADVLRCLYKDDKLSDDMVVVIPGEAILTDGVLCNLIDLHCQKVSDLTMLLGADVPREKSSNGGKMAPAPQRKKREDEDIEYIGLMEENRVVIKTPALAIEEDHNMEIPKALLARSRTMGHGGKLRLRNNLTDPHVYAFSRWVLGLLESKPNLSSIKSDLVPFLVRHQFRPMPTRDLEQTAGMERRNVVSGLIYKSHELTHEGASDFEMCRCFALICDPESQSPARTNLSSQRTANDLFWGGRADTIPAYMALNKEMMTSADALRRRDNSLVPSSCILQDKVTVKGTVLGDDVTVGNRVKLNNCVIMANVIIGANSVIQNSVLCKGAQIGEGCSLNDCQVAAHAEVSPGTKAKNESFNGKESAVGEVE